MFPSNKLWFLNAHSILSLIENVFFQMRNAPDEEVLISNSRNLAGAYSYLTYGVVGANIILISGGGRPRGFVSDSSFGWLQKYQQNYLFSVNFHVPFQFQPSPLQPFVFRHDQSLFINLRMLALFLSLSWWRPDWISILDLHVRTLLLFLIKKKTNKEKK